MGLLLLTCEVVGSCLWSLFARPPDALRPRGRAAVCEVDHGEAGAHPVPQDSAA
jgi:hypothetical protein